MDVTDNDSCPMSSPLSEEAIPPHMWEEEHPSEPTEAADRLDPASRVKREWPRNLVNASEAREAKIRELQDAIKNGTYHITPEQIADKMLRNMLRNDFP
jgi:flagellar biosynthesis anti-sigma factor FlgM